MQNDSWKNCTPDGLPPVVNKEYIINHCRKGKFQGKVLNADDTTWADVLITHGKANTLLDYNIAEEGETVTVRSTLCTMIPVN